MVFNIKLILFVVISNGKKTQVA